ncbi:MAG: 5-formyltetrahydrofolate cyclo-ligase [Actinomycetota bacterium]|nr:5-formyltetrahydrofolate cyclo-ligase [Actinomycetota bacterium]MDQ2848062.1 5-formyltetrahydrofolate cyclo-ligase [Actinomycetota bacterium]MDQ2958817.1 5-formyltetrahydrofolate cyclo-ligase [Actinomycetota bacterium]
MTDKAAVRARIKSARAALTTAERDQARDAIRTLVLSHCAATRIPPGSRIAAYQPLATEPGSAELLANLTEAGYQVIVPLTRPDRDLDWLLWKSPAASEPDRSADPADRLGLAAIAGAALVLVPAFAVDRHGHRLGRGGGSYDRALSRVPTSTPIAALLYRDELLDAVPNDVWDRPVSAVVTPAGWVELTPVGPRNSR